MTRYDDACPGIAGRILTAHEAEEADAVRAALSQALHDAAEAHVDDAWWVGGVHRVHRDTLLRAAAWGTVLWLLLAPEVRR